jgi:hypothetical protein
MRPVGLQICVELRKTYARLLLFKCEPYLSHIPSQMLAADDSALVYGRAVLTGAPGLVVGATQFTWAC